MRTKVMLWSPAVTVLLVTTLTPAAESWLAGGWTVPAAPSSAAADARKSTGQRAASRAATDFMGNVVEGNRGNAWSSGGTVSRKFGGFRFIERRSSLCRPIDREIRSSFFSSPSATWNFPPASFYATKSSAPFLIS
jgi:hypothetical protein